MLRTTTRLSVGRNPSATASSDSPSRITNAPRSMRSSHCFVVPPVPDRTTTTLLAPMDPKMRSQGSSAAATAPAIRTAQQHMRNPCRAAWKAARRLLTRLLTCPTRLHRRYPEPRASATGTERSWAPQVIIRSEQYVPVADARGSGDSVLPCDRIPKSCTKIKIVRLPWIPLVHRVHSPAQIHRKQYRQPPDPKPHSRPSLHGIRPVLAEPVHACVPVPVNLGARRQRVASAILRVYDEVLLEAADEHRV